VILKNYSCEGCGSVITRDVPMTAPRDQQSSQTEWCPKCQGTKTFQREYSPVAFTFGMLTHKYTGQAAAVNGWGTHKLDYDTKSDLATGRAQEAAQRIQPATNVG
jgi:NAD-dependent SIR2 family protein deacetylase